jgi:hypothetical protein
LAILATSTQIGDFFQMINVSILKEIKRASG